ncbi:hypothetical protein QWY82_16765 [Simiduia curdlanivorans]|uniref:Chemotaxis protein CheC n=1 Tax=Simiduia curdlanivorans TaxID=1492769 RepID=A0ABV8V1C8_9GAMM|nr:hypothetical protein [Simiduia curdlanivorans]MDN3640450.1 hypothetical protein [Simiduia curdlanivorans]
MSHPLPFSETYRDCLQELANIAMGAAGESLAAYCGGFVELPIPVIRYIEPAKLSESVASLQGAQRVSACAQSFATEMGLAYAMVVVADNDLATLAEARAITLDSSEQEQNLLKSLTGVICDTCLASLAEMAERSFKIEPVFVVAMHQPLDALQLDDLVSVDFVTSVEINYQLEGSDFNCDLLLLFPETLNQPLLDLLDQILLQ